MHLINASKKSIQGGIKIKNIKISVLLFILLMALAGCENPEKQEQTETDKTDDIASKTTQIEAETKENDFCLKLYADNHVYSTDEAVKIGAALEYIGDENSFTIWHGDPYLVFSITDGADFYLSDFVHDILIRTELKKGEQYHREFYQEKDLKLPAGTYTISVDGAFYLSEDIASAEKGPSCELQITVQQKQPTRREDL